MRTPEEWAAEASRRVGCFADDEEEEVACRKAVANVVRAAVKEAEDHLHDEMREIDERAAYLDGK